MYLLIFDVEKELKQIEEKLKASGQEINTSELKSLLDEINYNVIEAFLDSQSSQSIQDIDLDMLILSKMTSGLPDQVKEIVYYTLKEIETKYAYNYLNEEARRQIVDSVKYELNKQEISLDKINDTVLNKLCSISMNKFIGHKGSFAEALKDLADKREEVYDQLFRYKVAGNKKEVYKIRGEYLSLICAGMILSDLKMINGKALNERYLRDRDRCLQESLEDEPSPTSSTTSTRPIRLENIYDYLTANM